MKIKRQDNAPLVLALVPSLLLRPMRWQFSLYRLLKLQTFRYSSSKLWVGIGQVFNCALLYRFVDMHEIRYEVIHKMVLVHLAKGAIPLSSLLEVVCLADLLSGDFAFNPVHISGPEGASLGMPPPKLLGS